MMRSEKLYLKLFRTIEIKREIGEYARERGFAWDEDSVLNNKREGNHRIGEARPGSGVVALAMDVYANESANTHWNSYF